MDKQLKEYIGEFIEEIELSTEDAKLLYSTFLEELELELKSLNNFFTSQDYTNMKKTIHNIKGISSNYRVYEVYEKAIKIDHLIKVKEYDSSNSLVKEINNNFLNAKKEIGEYFGL